MQQTAEQRIGGADRYAVSANVSRWLPNQDGIRVVVAAGEVFADALSAGPLAAHLGARLLLTQKGELPASVRQELSRKRPQSIIVVGGSGSVSDKVEEDLAAIAPVTRIDGRDRYAVAAGAADRIQSDQVVIASGEVFSDALAAGPLAAKLGASLLLSGRNTLPQATRDALRRIGPKTVIVVGGPGTIDARTMKQIAAAAGVTPVRVGGQDRYEVAANVASRYFSDSRTALLASGSVFPDGLSGTPYAFASGAPILLGSDACTPAATVSALAGLKSLAHRVYLGGPASLTSSPYACGTTGIRPGVNPPKADLQGIIPAGTPGEEAIYFVPHQDDELISMAGGIVNDINAGRRVHVFLVNAGDWTGAKDALCSKQKVCLTDEQITASRNAEFLTSLEALGVPAGNVHFLYTKEQQPDAAEVVQKAVAEIVAGAGPDARYRSISWLDAHPGHYRVGYALRDTCVASGLRDCLFFQSPLYQKRTEGLQFRPVVTPTGSDLPIGKGQIARAANAYRTSSPADGRYAVGWESVQPQIAWIARYDASWAHGMVWSSSADEVAAADWIADYQKGQKRGPHPEMAALGLAVTESPDPDPIRARR